MKPPVERTVVAFLDNEDSADIVNPIHATEYARRYGFRGPLVGGVTVWGWSVPAILEAAGDEWLDRGWAEYAFLRPTYPGDRIAVRAARAEDGAGMSVSMTNQDGVVCVAGSVGLGDAAWLGDLRLPARTQPEPAPDPLPPLLLETAPIDADLVPMSLSMSVAGAVAYAHESQRTEDLRFAGEAPRLHPGWLAGRAEDLLRHNFAIPASMHTRSRVQHLAPALAGQRITVAGRFVEAYERRRHHFGVLDCLVLGEDGAPLAAMRHTTIFRIAPPEPGA